MSARKTEANQLDHLGLALVIEASRDEAKALFAAATERLPQEMGAVAGMMASVDFLSCTLFGAVESAYKAKRAKGEDASMKEAAAEAIYLLQELLNIRLAYELDRRGLIEIPKFDVKLH
jgi:hypothetical protein